MFDANNQDTVCSMRELFDLVRKQSKHIVFWIGAGASSWNGYPRWDELADQLHLQYVRHEAGYDKNRALRFLEEGNFPHLFQTCRDTNSGRFYSLLTEAFPARKPTPVYHRFAVALQHVTPTSVITTNVDELLEKELPGVPTVGRHDLERAAQLLRGGQASFASSTDQSATWDQLCSRLRIMPS